MPIIDKGIIKEGESLNYLVPTEHDLYLFHQGNLFYSYKLMGAHLTRIDGESGIRFTVWAPNAKKVMVVGDFNNWDGEQHIMERVNDSGVWYLFIPRLRQGELYKYKILTKANKYLYKSDPYAFYSEQKPATASIIYSLDAYEWNDSRWLDQRRTYYDKPMNIYEVHLGTWRRNENNRYKSYRDLAEELVGYVLEMGYTHIELLPLLEHPYDRSWGYQITGYFSITSRYGTPHDFMYFVDCCHQNGIGVILDWVPGHFVRDEHGLSLFDGTPLYEYMNVRKAQNDWGTLGFDLGRPEIQSFLISNAIFLMDIYHIDGLRVDAVASMLYLDFGKMDGEWDPNIYGGNENLESIAFFQKLNKAVFERYPTALMIAEESTAWPLVTAPTYLGGLGFNFKWNMGWMNDLLKYMELDPIYRKYHHNLLTFSFFYAYSENYVLPLSHDEVVYGKRSLLNKMHGDYWQKFASLRLFYVYMMTHPGKKLLFMGGEYGQFDEWKDEQEQDWYLMEYDAHSALKRFVIELNHFYLNEKILWELDHDPAGFEWIDANDSEQSVLTFVRKGKEEEWLIIICNFTPSSYDNYRIGVPELGCYKEIFNSDSSIYYGSGKGNFLGLEAESIKWHNQRFSLSICLPPLAAIILRHVN